MEKRIGAAQNIEGVRANFPASSLRLLGSYAPVQKLQPARTAEVHENASIAPYINAWEKFLIYEKRTEPFWYRNTIGWLADGWQLEYRKAIRILKTLPRPSAQEVEELSIIIPNLEDDEKHCAWDYGIFLSALVQRGKGKKFTVHTGQLDMPPDYLGYHNKKDLTVVGDVGREFLNGMRCGNVRVRGNVGEYMCHHMQLGTVLVEGNVKGAVGMEMLAGRVEIFGHVPDSPACNSGGIVHVLGRCPEKGGEGEDNGAFFRNNKLMRIGFPKLAGSIESALMWGTFGFLESMRNTCNLDIGFGKIVGIAFGIPIAGLYAHRLLYALRCKLFPK